MRRARYARLTDGKPFCRNDIGERSRLRTIPCVLVDVYNDVRAELGTVGGRRTFVKRFSDNRPRRDIEMCVRASAIRMQRTDGSGGERVVFPIRRRPTNETASGTSVSRSFFHSHTPFTATSRIRRCLFGIVDFRIVRFNTNLESVWLNSIFSNLCRQIINIARHSKKSIPIVISKDKKALFTNTVHVNGSKTVSAL